MSTEPNPPDGHDEPQATTPLDKVRLDIGVDLSIPMAEARKEGSTEFVAYKILVWLHEGNKLEKPPAEFSSFRRFSDFDYLRQYLVEAHRGVVVPPLPEKKFNLKLAISMSADHQDADFVEGRRRSLQHFLVLLLKHGELMKDNGLHLFLFGGDSWRSELVIVGPDGNRHVFQPSTSLLGPARSSQPDRRFLDVKNYAQTFQEQMQSLLSIHARLATKTHALHMAFHEYGSLCQKWTEQETELKETMKELSKWFDKMASVTLNVVRTESSLVDEPMKIFAGYAESLREVVKHQDAAVAAMEAAQVNYISKQKALAGLRDPSTDTSLGGMFNRWTAGSGDQRKAKEKAMEEQIEVLKKEAEKAQAEANALTENALKNIEAFHLEKRQELITIMLDFARTQMAYAKSNLKNWKRVQNSNGAMAAI
jgi:hypothetical protein